jgi:hypothetical protein
MNSIRQCVKEASNIRLERNKATAEVIETESALKRWIEPRDKNSKVEFPQMIDRSIRPLPTLFDQP